MRNSKYRYLLPNTVTFFSLGCGIIAILLSTQNRLQIAGSLVLASYILDLLDGGLARRFNASSAFGLQLDSLVDMVSLGMAPAAVLFVHLQNSTTLPQPLIWILVVLLPMAGAFRLARFNLLPPKKTTSSDSVGLTISTGGAMIVLTTTTDIVANIIPSFGFVLITLVIIGLMVSTISFPSITWITSRRRTTLAILALIGLSLTQWHPFQSWFVLTSGYLGASLARAGIHLGTSE